MADAHDLVYSWNHLNIQRLQRVRIEEDTRDALQSVRTVRPSLLQRRKLLELSDKVGVQFAFLGFPAASGPESDLCCALVEYIDSRRLGVQPVLMARALESDVTAILEIQQRCSLAVTADIFISISALRLHIEGWTLDVVLQKLRQAAHLAEVNGLSFRISLEDSSRTAPAELGRAVDEVVNLGAKAIVLCDTVGECQPDGASRMTSFVMEKIERSGNCVDVGWHGHNDKGLSLANALAAGEAGANIISGTFMGIGERTGNIPLEQVIVILNQAGNTMYDVRELAPLCEAFCSSSQIAMPPNLPIVGKDAFSTSTGTHAAALIKAKRMGREYEDIVYSAVSADSLGRSQTILIGPNSGRRAIHAILEEMRIPATDETVAKLLIHCKEHDRCLRHVQEILELLALPNKGFPPSV